MSEKPYPVPTGGGEGLSWRPIGATHWSNTLVVIVAVIEKSRHVEHEFMFKNLKLQWKDALQITTIGFIRTGEYGMV